MNRKSARRKVRKRKSTTQNSRMKFSTFLGIIVLAVFLGFLTARFVVGPLIGYDAGESPARAASEEKDEEEAAAEPEKGYALQFGAFSTEDAAEDLSENLKASGITTEIVKMDDVYKVIGPVLSTREKALEALSSLPENSVQDVFIASFSSGGL